MTIEITVHLKDEDKVYRQKFLSYEPLVLSQDDPQLINMVHEATTNFKGIPQDIVVKAEFIW